MHKWSSLGEVSYVLQYYASKIPSYLIVIIGCTNGANALSLGNHINFRERICVFVSPAGNWMWEIYLHITSSL